MTAAVPAFLQGDPARIALFEAVEAAVNPLGESSMAEAYHLSSCKR